MKLGSLFDGSGGFPLAGALNGIEPVWASEVEPYPIAVTTSRFPHMKHLGDVSKVNGAEIEPVDVLTFGSPCQDLSAAGLRRGLKHEANGDEETTRSGLFYEAIRIIKEMRYGTEGRSPTFVVWENVPGAFSSNRGEDFRTVLEELVKIAEPTAVVPDVPQGGWAYADCWRGNGWSLAYRVFDAQYLRTAQRRKRIYLVLCLGDEDGAGKILFERDRLRVHYPQSGKAWERTASHAEGSLDADDREGAVIKAGGFKELNSAKARSDGFAEEAAPTLAANKHDACVVIGFDGYNQALTGDKTMSITGAASDIHHIPGVVHDAENCSISIESSFFEAYQHHGYSKSQKAGTVNAAQNDHVRGDTPLICEFETYQKNVGALCARDYKGVGSQYVAEDKLVVESAVAYAIDQQGGKGGANYAENVMPTMCSDSHGTPHAVAYGIGNGQANKSFAEEVVGALNCIHDQQAVAVPAKPRYIVRRITPTECARLQGFPDRWGDIDHKDDMTDEDFRFWLEVRQTYDRINGRAKKYYTEKKILAWYNKLHNDGAEYKMWGNGIALPCALYVMEGIVEVAT